MMHKGFLALIASLVTVATLPLRADFFYTPMEYNNLYNEKVAMEIELRSLRETYGNDRKLLTDKIKELDTKIKSLEEAQARAKQAASEDDKRAKERIAELEKRVQIMKEKSSDREKKLVDDANRKEGELSKKLDQLRRQMQGEREACAKKLETTAAEFEKKLAEANARIASLNDEIASLKKLSDAQKAELDRMADQAKSLEEQLQKEIGEGQIRLKRLHDRIIINIDDRISFDSGSAELKKEIFPALKKITDILSRYPENRVFVEGHTDNVPIHTARFRDNWQLSTERGLAVLAQLLTNKKLNAARIAVAGYGELSPIVPNDTPENRALNRRVDIVVIPSGGK